jgi:hypothetical protein
LGRRIIVEYARGKKRDRDDRRDYRRERNTGPERSDYRVIVEGLARGTSWQDLKDAFRSTGDILFTDVRRNKKIFNKKNIHKNHLYILIAMIILYNNKRNSHLNLQYNIFFKKKKISFYLTFFFFLK